MSLNPYLHPRNPYCQRPDFGAMAKRDPAFRAVCRTDLKGKVNIDFLDRDAVRELTRALLKLDFGLEVDLPPSHLVPTLPLR